MCVSCGGRWVDEDDLDGMRVVPASLSSGGVGSVQRNGVGSGERGESPRSKRRREMYGITFGGEAESEEREEFDIDEKDLEEAAAEIPSLQPQPHQLLPSSRSANPTLTSALGTTTSSLARTLDRLASSLNRHTPSSGENEGRYFVDVKLHTEAIKDVLEVLGMVEKYKAA